MKGWETRLPPSFPMERLHRDAVREADRRRSRRRRRQQRAASGVCALMLAGTGVLIVQRDAPPRELRAGPPHTGAPGDIGDTDGRTSVARANGKIAFVRSTGPQDPAPKIYVMNADGSDQVMIAETTQGGDLTWSPDGTKLAFRDVGGIYTVNADGTDEARVPSTTNLDQWPSWSPDGTKLAVRIFEGRTGRIDVVNVDGTGRRTVTTGDVAWPAWSPDGRRIAYSSAGELYVINADGSGRRQLTTTGGFDDAPTWSPDGRKIAFRHNSTISVIDVGGGQARALASPGGTAVVNPAGQGANKLAVGGGSPSTPQWSPDGRKILYGLHQTGEACSIWIMNADGTGQAPLTDSRMCDRDPAWQPRPA